MRVRLVGGRSNDPQLESEADTERADVVRKLGDLADRFAEAARTGDMSTLRSAARSSSARGALDVEKLISAALGDLRRRSA